MRCAFSILAGSMLCACVSKSIEVGPTGGASTTGGTDAHFNVPPRPTWPSGDACAGANPQPMVGLWKGYIEAQPAPWDTILLDIQGVTETGTLCATMTLGKGTPPPPATNPDIGYPPGLIVNLTSFRPPIIEGFTYTLLDGTVQDGRARFGLPNNQPWRGWCALQAPIADPVNYRYGCLPNTGAMVDPNTHECRIPLDGMDGMYVPVDCRKLTLCGPGSPCVCDAQGCDADPNGRYLFDLHFDVASADGAGPTANGGGFTGRARFFKSE